MTSPIDARAAGVIPDGPDNTVILNSIVDGVNAAGVPTSIIWPQGRVLHGPLHPITAPNVFIVPESRSPNVCRSKRNGPGTLFQWGDASHVVEGGGTIGIGFDDTSADTTSPTICVSNAARLVFDEVDLAGVGLFALLGPTGGVCSQTTFKRLHGYGANVPVPLIRGVRGSGAIILDPDVFSNAAGAFAVVPGRHFLSIENGWDTVILTGGLIQLFDVGLNLSAPAGASITNVKKIGGFFDGCGQGVVGAAEAGGFISTIEITDTEITAVTGRGAMFIGAGKFNEIAVRGCRILQTKYDGLAFFAPTENVTVTDNSLWGINQAGVSTAALNFSYPLDYAVISGNRGGRDMGPDLGVPGVPTYGTLIASGDNIKALGNQVHGAAVNTYIGALGPNSKGRGNLGVADFGA